MAVLVRIPTPLRKLTDNADRVEVDANDLSSAIATLENKYPGMKDRLVDAEGELRHFINIYLNGEDVRFLQGLNTSIKTGDELSIVPAVAGGAR